VTSLETLHTKNAINKHSFPVVIHMAYFDTRFGRYRLLNSGQGAVVFWAEQIGDCNSQD
jgi:hypothetical protein